MRRPHMNKKINPCIKGEKPFELTLNDCLACSGCVSMEETKITAEDLQNVPINLIMSHYSVLNLCNEIKKQQLKQNKDDSTNLHAITVKEWYAYLQNALRRKFSVKRIVNTYDYQQLSNYMIYNELLTKNKLILSECPGVVAYVERRRPDLIPYLSEVPSLQQMCAYLCEEEGVLTVGVMQCHDKRLEGGVRVDYVLSSKDIYEICSDVRINFEVDNNDRDIYDDVGVGNEGKGDNNGRDIHDDVGVGNEGKGDNNGRDTYDDVGVGNEGKGDNNGRDIYDDVGVNGKDNNIYETCNGVHTNDKDDNNTNTHNDRLSPEQHSKNSSEHVLTNEKEFLTGITPYLIKMLNLTIERIQTINKSYRVLHFKNSSLTFAHITGLKNLLNFLNDEEMRYNFVDIFLCDDRCFGGPGQIKNNVQNDYAHYFKLVGLNTNEEVIVPQVLKDKKRIFENRKIYRSNFKVEW
ncbi:ferredoxin hydrogenase [Trachipleistophora hominis]|uniref:Ferredoxin hydrogenase n=1 Tax=Trachipleistophora hominis TaxID=72359 RepID=L7JYG9_TRAHO|nr:ferredoxin hydrogenase [Trachipleistophora hominis]